MDISSWFLDNGNVVFSGVVAVSTVAYAVLTWRLVSETRLLRKAQTEPKLAVYVVLQSGTGPVLDLRIENVGSGIASDIHLSANPDIDAIGGRKINQLGPFSNGIPMLAPGQARQFMLTILIGGDDFEERISTEFIVTATYKRWSGEDIADTFTIDFSEFRELSIGSKPPIFKIADAIEKIQRDVGHLTSGFRTLKVDTFTSEDRTKKESDRKVWLAEKLEEQDESDKGEDADTKR